MIGEHSDGAAAITAARLNRNVRARHEQRALPSQVRLRIRECDYYQVAFENNDPAGDAAEVDGPDSPYLLIQRQFEDPDGGRCYVETHDEGYIGHFRLRSIVFSPSRLLLEIARDRNNRIEVIFDIGQSEFEEVRRVIDIISGKSSPDDGHVL